MKKLFICKSATLLCGVLAIGIFAKLDSITVHVRHGDLIGASLGLLSAIFGTQWIEYRKRLDADAAQPGRPDWFRRLLAVAISSIKRYLQALPFRAY